jgi:hypothetical protein
MGEIWRRMSWFDVAMALVFWYVTATALFCMILCRIGGVKDAFPAPERTRRRSSLIGPS